MAKQTSGSANVSPVVAQGTAAAEPVGMGFESRLIQLWFAWGKRVAVALGLLVLVLILVAVWQAQRADRLASGYAAIKAAGTAEKLGAVAKEYSGSVIAAQATFAQAKRLFDDGKFDQAASRFSVFCRDFPRDPLVIQASLGEAYALEAGGKAPIAEKKFAEIAKSVKDLDLMADAYLAAGRCAESQGKAKEAEAWYKSAVSSGVSGALKDKALSALKRFPAGGK